MLNPTKELFTDLARDQQPNGGNEMIGNPYGPRSKSREEIEAEEKRLREERERACREASERGARTASPAPEPYLSNGDINPAWRAAHSRQVVVNLPGSNRSWSQGNLPEVDSRSEAEQMLDPKNMLKRIMQLEQRVAQLEADKARFYGGAGDAGGEVYR